MSKIEYLGDGVYVEMDGYHVKLMANSASFPSDIIYLEPSVVEALKQYFKSLENKNDQSNNT